MPITQSAKKALRSSARKRTFNNARKRTAAETVKTFKKLVAEKKVKEAQALLPKLQQALDKSAKRGVIKSGAADRKKSRLVATLKKAQG
jgi:ribosomal protein S20